MRIFNRGNLNRFKRDTSGSIATFFGLSLIPMVLAGAAAIDTVYMYGMQQKLVKSLDAAVLAVAAAPTTLSKADREKIGEDVFYANIPKDALNKNSGKPQFTISAEKVTAGIEAQVNTSLMALAGIDTVDFAVGAEVAIKKKKKAEIALVLDYSGSMGEKVGSETKYIAMRNAATKLIDDLVKLDKDKVKFGLVPFSHHVMAPLPGRYVASVSHTETRLTCTQDRPYPANLTDKTPDTTLGSSDVTKWGQPQAPEHLNEDCTGYLGRSLIVRPLTDDFKGLKDQLANMVPYAWTHIALGAEFGFHVLSPDKPFDDEVADYDDDGVEKFMVLLTDGKQTEPAFGPGGIRTVEQGEKNLLSICENAKAEGIKIISIAFDLDDSATRQNLASCASDADKFFVVEDGRELAGAFDSIKQLLVTAFYMSK
jgi:Flp pilus assembly protein TadG